MTIVSITCDVSQPDGTEFLTARLEFALSGPDYDTASGEAIPAVTTYVDLDASGQGEADLWPVDLGTRNTFYSVVLRWSVLRDGRTSEVVSTLGRIQPQAAGGQTLADLLAQSSGGIVVGSVIYETLADAVAAALAAAVEAAAAAAGADPVAAIAARDKAQEWAENPVDDPVETGQYSALHHATKAGEHEAASELAAQQSAAFPFVGRDTLAALLADTTFSYTVGSGKVVLAVGGVLLVRKGGYSYQVLDAAAATYDIITAGGVKLAVMDTGEVPDAAFFTATNVDDTAGLQKYFDWCAAKNRPVRLVQQVYRITNTIVSNVRMIDGGMDHVGSPAQGTVITFAPTVLTDMKPAIEIAGQMIRSGVIRGIRIQGTQSYSMANAPTWCPSPELLPAYTAFADGPCGFKISGSNQPVFKNCSTGNLKIGRLDDSTNGHIYSYDCSWHGWLGGVRCKKTSGDYRFYGGSVQGLFANYVLGTELFVGQYGGAEVFMHGVHMGFASYGFYQVNDAGLPPTGVYSNGLAGELDVRFEQIGECAIKMLDASLLLGLDLKHTGFGWSAKHTDWENTSANAYNLHPSILPYADQQKYAVQFGRMRDKNRLNILGDRYPLVKSPNNVSGKIARVAVWEVADSTASDHGAFMNDIDVVAWGSGSRRWRQRKGDKISRGDLLLRQGILEPNLLRAPEILTNWIPTGGATLTLSDLATIGGAYPQQMVDELGANPVVVAIPAGAGYGGRLPQFGASRLPAQQGRVVGISFWINSARARHRLTMYPSGGGETHYYDISVLGTAGIWERREYTGRDFIDQLGEFQVYSSNVGATYYPVHLAGIMAHLDDVKPYNPSPAPYKPGGFPTAATGLPAGSIWSNAGVLTVAS